ncbi:MAG: cysteine desulfurase family protein [Candidatus Paceibacterota bacterium]|jgi:cysteine desulfurase
MKKQGKSRVNSNRLHLTRVYLDCAAATPVDKEVEKAMQPYMGKLYANPGGLHKEGVEAKNALVSARASIASILFARPEEIIFTSGGTESDNLAVLGIVTSYKLQVTKKKPHIVTTNIEHSAVREVCKFLEENKMAEVTYVPVESNGIVDPKKIRSALKGNTVLVSVMYVNNEIGTIQPISEIAKSIRHFKKLRRGDGIYPLFHTDAAQAIAYLPVRVDRLGVDLLSCNGAKIYGPKGVGFLYVKKSTPIKSMLHGGNQEYDLRAGTENMPGIIGIAKALEICEKLKEKESNRLTKLRNYFIEQIKKHIPEAVLNGDQITRLPNNVNISIPQIDSELLVLELDACGIAVSSKSACKSDDPDESYVISALRIGGKPGFPQEEGSVRFSMGRQTTKQDIDYTLKTLKQIIVKIKKWKM